MAYAPAFVAGKELLEDRAETYCFGEQWSVQEQARGHEFFEAAAKGKFSVTFREACVEYYLCTVNAP